LKLATFDRKGSRRLGAMAGERVIDLADAVGHPVFPATMETLVGARGTVLDAAREAVQRDDAAEFAVPAARLEAPILPASLRDFGEGRVYRTGNHRSVVGTGAAIEPPPFIRELDVEAKLACVVGRWGRELSVSEAARAVFGYTLAIGWVARDEERRERAAGGGPARSRDFATSLGPVVVTVDEAPELLGLTLELRVDGAPRAEGGVVSVGWSFAEMLAHVSKAQHLWPGDVVLAGAVSLRCDEQPVPCLDRGATVEVEAEGFGVLTASVAAARPARRFG